MIGVDKLREVAEIPTFEGALDLAYESANSTFYRLILDIPYLLKKFHPDSRHLREISGDYYQKVFQLNLIDSMIKKYYGRHFVSAYYFVRESNKQLTVASIRPEITGTSLANLPLNSEKRFDGLQMKYHWEVLWGEMLADEKLKSVSTKTMRALVIPDFSMDNIIFQRPDNYYIIDW